MKIAYFCNAIDKAGGLDRIVIEKANYLSMQNEVYIITTNQKEKNYYYTLSSSIKHIDFYDYGCNSFLLFAKRCFNKILDDIKPDIIVVATAKESLFLPFFNSKIPKVKEVHFSRNHRKIQNKDANFFKKAFIFFIDYIEYRVSAFYDRLVLLTYEDKNSWKLNNTTVIYNFKTISSNETSILENFDVIAVGRLNYQKGFDLLLKSWAIVVKSCPNWRLNIYGDGELKEELKELSKSLNIDGSVVFHGNTKDIKQKYLKSSIYVLSSRHEGLPLVLPEAMECGLPIVSFKSPCGPRDIIDNGKNGFLVENYNTQELAKKIIKLIKSKELRVKIGKEAKLKSLEFEKDKIMNQWMQLFKEVIKDRRKV